jgi:signal peptidase I
VVDIARINSHDMNDTYAYGDAMLIRRSVKELRRGDVVQFNFPVKDSLAPAATMMQRVIGLPGDTVQIAEKIVLVNGLRMQDTSLVKHNYFVRARHKLDTAFRLAYNLMEGGDISERGDYSFSLTELDVLKLRRDTSISSVELKTEKAGNWDETLFPSSKQYKWNLDHYGPLYIPQVQDTLRLDTLNLPLYETLITRFEKNLLERRSDSIFINGKHTTRYVVKKNYYFVMGDNRDNASDSRTWGFLPDNAIKGKVITVIRRDDK